jgi:uncharacterized protein
MERQSISSSMITSAGYDSNSGVLEIEFSKGGAIWQYFDVPEHIWHEFIGSASQGQYWHQHIKNHFREARVG